MNISSNHLNKNHHHIWGLTPNLKFEVREKWVGDCSFKWLGETLDSQFIFFPKLALDFYGFIKIAIALPLPFPKCDPYSNGGRDHLTSSQLPLLDTFGPSKFLSS